MGFRSVSWGCRRRTARPRATSCNTFREVLHAAPAGIGWGFIPFYGGAADARPPVQHCGTLFAECFTARRPESDGVSFRFVGVGAGRGHTKSRGCGLMPAPARSEEHTSDLQSLMRISYAVIRLNTKHSPARYIKYK